jgi:hypothetical protein
VFMELIALCCRPDLGKKPGSTEVLALPPWYGRIFSGFLLAVRRRPSPVAVNHILLEAIDHLVAVLTGHPASIREACSPEG